MVYRKAPSKKKTFSRSKKSRSRTTRKKVIRTVAVKDNTIMKYNPGRAPIARVTKSITLFQPYVNGTAGTTGLQFIGTTTSIVNAAASMTFDLSGTFGNHSAIIVGGGAFSGIAAQVLDWNFLVRMYSYYRVKKITCRFTAQDTGSLTTAPPIIYVRYGNVYPAVTPTQGSIAEQRNWCRKTFTVEHPDFAYSFYPKIMVLADNVGLLSTETRLPKSMPWTNCTTPMELYGLQIIAQYPASASGTVTYLNMDVEYHMEFKMAN